MDRPKRTRFPWMLKTLGACHSCCTKLNKWHLLPFILLIVYTLAGGILFYLIESHGRATSQRGAVVEGSTFRQRLESHQTQMTWRMWRVLQSRNRTLRSAQAKEAWRWYDAKLLRDLRLCSHRTAAYDERWDFWSSVYYAVTVYTTIGYGDITPRTATGKVLTMIYALIGIPLMFYILQSWGLMLLVWAQGAARLVRRLTGRLSKKWREPPYQSRSRTSELPLTIAFLIVAFWLCLSAALFLGIEEDWNYMTSFYFLFISFTTIGFGDVVPANRGRTLLCIIPVIVGLSSVSMTITLLQQKIQEMFETMKEKIELEYRKAQTDPSTSRLTIKEGAADARQQMRWLENELTIDRRILLKMMNKAQRHLLEEHWTKRSGMRNVATQVSTSQTEDEMQTYFDDRGDHKSSYIYNVIE
uniref:Potassium channel domain-containing protein n=1 Tax=Trichuris muris TaxID=70415 RepID=A0A5S6QSR3_TRIMR